MSVYTTSAPVRNTVPDTIETVAYDETGDILLWVEDARPTPCAWDRHVSEPTAGFATAVARKEAQQELPEVDFMSAELERIRCNGALLHEDPEDGEEPLFTEEIGYWESRRPDWF